MYQNKDKLFIQKQDISRSSQSWFANNKETNEENK